MKMAQNLLQLHELDVINAWGSDGKAKMCACTRDNEFCQRLLHLHEMDAINAGGSDGKTKMSACTREFCQRPR
jgi:hypothetical protein